MNRNLLFLIILFSITFISFAGGSSEGNLDRAIDAQGNYLNNNIPSNSIIAIVGISSGSEDLSRYITEGLTSYIINNNIKNIKIVERAAMPILQKEIKFQYSGAVDDNFMVSLGKMVGANVVVAGTIYSIGKELRFNVRAIEIESSYIIVSNGMDFSSDKKIKTLLDGGTVEKTLNRDNIPKRQNDGSISKANQELRENQKKAVNNAVNNTVNYFSKDFLDREPRWLFGYNYCPDYPFGLEIGYLKNGLGFFFNSGMDFSFSSYSFSYIGDSVGVMNLLLGITYPLYFNWLWLSAGIEGYMVDTASYAHSYNNETTFLGMPHNGLGFSGGIYISIKRIYITAKYRYLFTDNKNNYLLGIGFNL
jgi:TolB-like protein